MTTAPSLTGRLIWTLTAAAAVLWVAATLVAANALQSRLDAAFDGGLRETAERVLALAADSIYDTDGDHGHDNHEVRPYDQTEDEYIVYQVRLADGSIVLRSHDAPQAPFAVPLAAGFSNAGPWRVYTLGTPKGDVFIQVAEANEHRAESLRSSIFSLLLPIGLLTPLSALGIFVAVRSGLRPVRDLSLKINERHGRNLAPIGETGLPRELQPIAHAIDGLIGRIRAAFDSERAFAANSAHELRTPIAGSLALVELLLREIGDHPARARAAQVEASLQRLRALSDKLLQLSRADAGIAATDEPVDLAPAIELLVDDARRTGMTLPVELQIEGDAHLKVPIDLDAFGIALRNLIENAQRHGKPPIIVRVADRAVEVINAGPVVPAAELAILKSRFARGQTSAEGSGLGLAIVDTIVENAGGRLDLISPAPGRADGFCAKVSFLS
jgi:two-component system OmpR family sensor kinase